MSKISYLGDKYTHTYAAAEKIKSQGDELVGYRTILASIEAVTHGESDLAIAPIENSCGGSIADTLDALWMLPLYIVKETVLAVPQHLVGMNGAKKSDLKVIYSHPQAISQCNDYLCANFASAEIIAVSSTAQALSLVKENHVGAIARMASDGLTVIEEDVEDVKNNSTRFVVLSDRPNDEGNKCSVVFETQNKPGTLVEALGLFDKYGLNMTKIESRPHKSKLGRYVFFVDFDFSGQEKLSEVLGQLAQKTLALKFLGKYPTV